MTKTEVSDKAWKLGLKGDFSLVDKIYHSKYRAAHKSIDIEVEIEADKIEADKIVISTHSKLMIFGLFLVIFENEKFLCLERNVRIMVGREPIYNTLITAITYNDGKIITQESVGERVQLTSAEAKTGAGKIINNILFVRDDQPSFLSTQFTEFN